jgi:F0F1-type ATP synthase assembly protein I
LLVTVASYPLALAIAYVVDIVILHSSPWLLMASVLIGMAVVDAWGWKGRSTRNDQ